MTRDAFDRAQANGIERIGSPDELETGKRYYIISGWGQNESGECIEITRSSFGMVWGTIKTETGSYSTRWHLLAHAG